MIRYFTSDLITFKIFQPIDNRVRTPVDFHDMADAGANHRIGFLLSAKAIRLGRIVSKEKIRGSSCRSNRSQSLNQQNFMHAMDGSGNEKGEV